LTHADLDAEVFVEQALGHLMLGLGLFLVLVGSGVLVPVVGSSFGLAVPFEKFVELS
jgi:hypothetical protein